MRAIQFDRFGDYSELKVVDVPQPDPADGEVLVKLSAAAVNAFDNTVRMGYVAQVQAPMILGNEGAGVVVGPGTAALPAGTRVMVSGTYGFGRAGTWQEYVTAGPTEAVVVPDNLTDVQAAATSVAYLAAEMALTIGCAITPGMTLLIPGVGGTVGNAALQLARIHGAGRLITSASRTDKAERGREQGFDDVIDLSKERLSEGVMRLTDGKGVDVALDTIGGTITGEALASLAAGGRLVQMGYPAGTTPTIDVMNLIWKPASIHGFNMYFMPPEAFAAAWATILPLLASGQLTPAVDRTYPLEEAAEANRHMIEDRPYGKVVLTI